MADLPTCQRITGKAFEPHYWALEPERQGQRRHQDEPNPNRRTGTFRGPKPEAVYDVLCGFPARYQVGPATPGSPSASVCGSCLGAAVQSVLEAVPEVKVREIR